MQYTIRNIPPQVDAVARKRARQQGTSLNQTLVEALEQALGLSRTATKRRDLRTIAGSWREDAEFDEAVAEQHRIDRKLWK